MDTRACIRSRTTDATSAGDRDADAASAQPRSLDVSGPSGVIALQRAAGNAAVSALLSRDTAPPASEPRAGSPIGGQQPQPAPASPGTPGQTANLGSPPKVERVEPGVDLAADTQTVTVTAVLRNLNAGSIGSLDLLSEPNVSLVFAPGPQPQPVVQAAIAALNLHIRARGREVLSLTVSPQAGVGPSGPTAGVGAQAEYHITTSFSLTATSAVTAQRGSDEPDPGSLRLGRAGPVDINWSPVTVGVLWHFGADEQPRRPGAPLDYDEIARSAAAITWVRGQLDRADFDNGDRDPNANTVGAIDEFISQLGDAMRAARGQDMAQLQLPLGRTRPPARLTQGLTRAAALIAGADPSLSTLRGVRVSIITENAAGTSSVRWTYLPLR